MRLPLLVPLLLPFALTGCSLLLDVEPDCDAARDCGGYRCNAEQTACLNTCAAENECTAGFACDEPTQSCRQIADLEAEPIALAALPTWGEEFAFGSAGSLLSTEFGLVVGGSEGLGLARFSTAGAALAASLEPAPFALERLAPISAQRARFLPTVGRALPSTTAGLSEAALLFGWAEPSADRNRLFVARRTIGEGQAIATPLLLRDASSQASLSQLTFAAGPDLVMALWREQSGVSSELRAMPLAADSLTPILGAASRLTGSNEVAANPIALRLGERWGALYLSSELGVRTVRVIGLESDASQLGELDLNIPVPNAVELGDLVATETASGAAAAYTQLEGGQKSLRGLLLPATAVAALGDPAQTATSGPTFAVSEGTASISKPAIASVDGEVAVAWLSIGEDRARSLMLRRFNGEGVALSPAGVVVSDAGGTVIDLKLAATVNGYALLWFTRDNNQTKGFWLPLGR
jgi:hypothetical protein